MANLVLESKLRGLVCGIDEVGRGPLVGPVTAAAVYIPENARNKSFWRVVTDSKQLSEKRREELFPLITEHCLWGIGHAEAQEIDKINILQATFLAMRRAYDDLNLPMDHALIDGNKTPGLTCNEVAVVKGDTKSLSIAAASIIAKVTRDRYMRELHAEFPNYAWDSNAGYGTKAHIEAMLKHGITKHHRQSFKPISIIRNGTI